MMHSPVKRSGWKVTGRPEPPTVNSPPESLGSHTYTLVFTAKSFSTLNHVEVRYRTKVY
jgi:hypothetical protein